MLKLCTYKVGIKEELINFAQREKDICDIKVVQPLEKYKCPI